MDKIRISLTVAEQTVEGLDGLSSELFPHISVSRGDVVDYLVAETLRVIKERGSSLILFPHFDETKSEAK